MNWYKKAQTDGIQAPNVQDSQYYNTPQTMGRGADAITVQGCTVIFNASNLIIQNGQESAQLQLTPEQIDSLKRDLPALNGNTQPIGYA